jgi:Short C-terminal domain
MDVASPREEGLGARQLVPTLAVGFSLAGIACGLTLTFLSMRSVMNVGGFCAEGGPYQIRQHCPQGVPGLLLGGIWGGVILALVYIGVVIKWHVPHFIHLLWSALFLSLGWNFFEFAFNPPGTTKGVVWGWLICGVLFVLMGGLPLIVVVPAVVREFLYGKEQRHNFPGGVPVDHARRVAQTFGVTRQSGMVGDLERLEALRKSGTLTDDEYEAAKRRLLGT